MHRREPAPAELVKADELRRALEADHCPGGPTAAQSIVLSMLTSAAARHASVNGYLATLPHPWCDRRSRRAWRLLSDLTSLEGHVARLLVVLGDAALRRADAVPQDLDAFLAEHDAADPPDVDADSSGPPAVDPGGECQE
jgi:hypothetical protein